MRPILHHTTKYDGGLHYRFQAQVVIELETTLVLYRGPGVEIVSYRGSMTANRHLMVIFYGDRYHNVVISWHDDWTPHMHYVNIATPAKWDADTVTAVDMDLDILRLTEDGKVIIDDEDEFEHHRELFQYQIPEVGIHQIRQSLAYNYPLGDDRFQIQIENALGRRNRSEILAEKH